MSSPRISAMHWAPFLRLICLLCVSTTLAQKREKTILDLARAFAADTSELDSVVAAGKIAIAHSATAIRSGTNHRTTGFHMPVRPLAPVTTEVEGARSDEKYQRTIVHDVGTALIEAVAPFDAGVAAAAGRAAADSIPVAEHIIQHWAATQRTVEQYDVAASSPGSLLFAVFHRAVVGSVIAVSLAVAVFAAVALGESRTR